MVGDELPAIRPEHRVYSRFLHLARDLRRLGDPPRWTAVSRWLRVCLQTKIFGWILRGFLAVDFALFVLSFIPSFSGIGPEPELLTSFGELLVWAAGGPTLYGCARSRS